MVARCFCYTLDNTIRLCYSKFRALKGAFNICLCPLHKVSFTAPQRKPRGGKRFFLTHFFARDNIMYSEEREE